MTTGPMVVAGSVPLVSPEDSSSQQRTLLDVSLMLFLFVSFNTMVTTQLLEKYLYIHGNKKKERRRLNSSLDATRESKAIKHVSFSPCLARAAQRLVAQRLVARHLVARSERPTGAAQFQATFHNQIALKYFTFWMMELLSHLPAT